MTHPLQCFCSVVSPSVHLLLLRLLLLQPQNVDEYPSDEDVPPPPAQQEQQGQDNKGQQGPAAAGGWMGVCVGGCR
jgi:hypothetical protein